MDEDELIAALPGVQLLGIGSKTQVTARVLEAATDLVAVGAFCIGTNQIDLEAAARRGITVFNAPFSTTQSVVELALAEIIALTRHLTEKNTLMHQGVWDKSAEGAHEVRGRTLGIVGYGKICTESSLSPRSCRRTLSNDDVVERSSLSNAVGAASRCRKLCWRKQTS